MGRYEKLFNILEEMEEARTKGDNALVRTLSKFDFEEEYNAVFGDVRLLEENSPEAMYSKARESFLLSASSDMVPSPLKREVLFEEAKRLKDSIPSEYRN